MIRGVCKNQSKPAPVASAASSAAQGGNGTTEFGRAASGALASSLQQGGSAQPASPQQYRSPVSSFSERFQHKIGCDHGQFGRTTSSGLASSSQQGRGTSPASPQHFDSPITLLWNEALHVDTAVRRAASNRLISSSQPGGRALPASPQPQRSLVSVVQSYCGIQQ